MARIRNISPKFFEDETMAKLPLGARLTYIGIWTRCNMHGVFEWNVKLLVCALFPHDDGIDAAAVEKWMRALEELGRVSRFESEGKRYGFLPSFSEHQAISKAERDQDAKARALGRDVLPMPPDGMVPKTVLGTVSRTVPKTLDEGQRTRDEGRGRGATDPDPDDLTGPAAESTPQQPDHVSLAPWVRTSVKDPERTAELRAELRQLCQQHGRQRVQQVAERLLLQDAEKRKPYPEDIQAAILSESDENRHSQPLPEVPEGFSE